MKTCTIDGCDNKYVAHGWCSKHYRRWYIHGDPHTLLQEHGPANGKCSIEDCKERHHAKGYCSKHYARMERGTDLHNARRYEDGPEDGLCSIEDCDGEHDARGLCKKHYTRLMRREDINWRLKENMRSRIYSATKRDYKSGSAVDDLGCSIEEFKLYIENQFEEGMSWDNYGEWHLDHVMPLDRFDLSNEMEFKEASNYLNYQPLWAEDNLSKHASYGT